MPILKSPEVIVTPHVSGLTAFRQEVNRDPVLGDYETDVGLNDRLGLNVTCASVQIYDLLSKGVSRMSLYLGEHWARKDEVLFDLRNKHRLAVEEKRLPYNANLMAIEISGTDDVLAAGEHLRGVFEETVHKGASIVRNFIHPALLGEAMDAVQKSVIAARSRQTQDWGAAFVEYGWRR